MRGLLLMKYVTSSIGTTPTLGDLLRPREIGEQVVSHVLEDAKQPTPDFEAMRRMLSEQAPADVEP